MKLASPMLMQSQPQLDIIVLLYVHCLWFDTAAVPYVI